MAPGGGGAPPPQNLQDFTFFYESLPPNFAVDMAIFRVAKSSYNKKKYFENMQNKNEAEFCKKKQYSFFFLRGGDWQNRGGGR